MNPGGLRGLDVIAASEKPPVRAPVKNLEKIKSESLCVFTQLLHHDWKNGTQGRF